MGPSLRRVHKAHGAGNDFVLLLGEGDCIDDDMAAAARELCDRHRSLGGDGLVWIDTASLPDRAPVRVWNPDGSVVGMCLNAARCVAVLLARLFGVSQVRIEFASVAIEAQATPGGARLRFALQSSGRPDPTVSGIGTDEWFVRLADPHVVIGCGSEDAIRDAPLADIAQAHASGGGLSDRPPNCHLVTRDDGTAHHRIRSFERRVEAETQACGSGCVAAYLALALEGEHTFLTGSGDRIRLSRAGSAWSLEGPAVLVYDTQVRISALAATA